MKKSRVIATFGSIGIICALIFYFFADAFYTSQFRLMTDNISSTQQVDLRGLRELRASGGNLVRFSDLSHKLSHIKGRKIIVDGMAEFHGYIYGIPTTFLAYQRKAPGLKHLIRRLVFTGSPEIRLDLVKTEEDEAKTYGFDYKKINIGSNFIETNENIDQIVDFFNQQPSDAWYHFHCARGKGRTSVLLVMFDIIKNAPEVALNDIVKRQHLLGSEDLFDTEVWKNGTYDKTMLENRKKFIEDFYEFICQRNSGGLQQWSEWKSQKKVK